MENLAKYLDVVMEDLTPEQIQKLDSTALSSQPTPEQALKILEDVGLDLHTIQKKIGQKRVEEVKNRVKIGVNEKCLCGSGLKYKKCCKQ